MPVEGTTAGESGLYYDQEGHKQLWSVDYEGNWTKEQVWGGKRWRTARLLNGHRNGSTMPECPPRKEWVKDEASGEWNEIEINEEVKEGARVCVCE